MGGYHRTTAPPSGHSVIHKMRPFYRPPSTLAFVAVVSISGSENGKWRLKIGHAKSHIRHQSVGLMYVRTHFYFFKVWALVGCFPHRNPA